jgi:hypothetical protein
MEKEDIFSEEGIECPYCGYIEDEVEIIYNTDLEKQDCGNCGKTMYATADISWSWTTSKREKEDILKEIEQERFNMKINTRHEDKKINESMRKHFEWKIEKLKKEIEELD